MRGDDGRSNDANGPSRSAVDSFTFHIAHVSVDSSRDHSSLDDARLARKLMPSVPNFAALDAWGASAYTSTRSTISNPTNPAATTVA
jgi:hypothetical protein